MRIRGALVAIFAASMLLAAQTSGASTVHPAKRPLGTAGMALKKSVLAPVSAASQGPVPSSIECTSVPSSATNVLLDACGFVDRLLPANEGHIAVDPTNPAHIIASANDYASCCDEFYTTFNHGNTWTSGDMSVEDNRRIGSDPVTAFDTAHGTAIHLSLNFTFNNQGDACDSDVVASVSTDGGLHWQAPSIVYDGGGITQCESNGIFNDKEWITVDNNPSSPHYGTAYATWSRFLDVAGVYLESPIWAAYSTDGGYTWLGQQEISGSSTNFCTFQSDAGTGPFQCDEDQFSDPVVAPDGSVYVAFENEQHAAAWEAGEVFENQYMVVKSINGGASYGAPVHVADLEDGSRDLPINVDGRQTLTGMQFRWNSAGDLAIAPNGTMYMLFNDNRNGAHDVSNPVTNVDVFVKKSTNGGATWSGPFTVAGFASDQFYPWLDVNPVNGQLGVVYMDRHWGGLTNLYNASYTHGNIGAFSTIKESTASSHPRNSLFFDARTSSCRKCAVFIGDYNSLAFGSDGQPNMVWTDMRRFYDLGGSFHGYAENMFYGRL